MSRRRSMRSAAFVAATLATSLVSLSALANKSGLAGYTGKPNLSAPAGESCNQCHTGGAAPQVTLTGPATLTAGQVADYSLVVTTGASRAAGAIAATDGIVLTPVSGLRDSFGEMVPNGGVATAGGSATFAFRVTAPLTGTTLRLWAVGLAANGNNGVSGDKATHLVRDVAVTGGTTPKPDAGSSSGGDASVEPPPGTDGGSSGASGSSGGASGSSGSSGSSSGSSGSSGSSSGDDGTDDPATPGSSSGGGGNGASCSSSPSPRGRGQGTIGVMLAALGILQLVAHRRRRRA